MEQNQNEKTGTTHAKRRTVNHKKSRHAQSFWRKMVLFFIGLIVFVFVITKVASMIFDRMDEDNVPKELADLVAVPEDLASQAITPVQTVFSSVVDWVRDYFYSLKLRSRLELEYNNLKQENEQLMYQVMLLTELENKLTVYENLYDEVSANESLNPLVATVIGRENGNYYSVFTINKGSSDGVKDYMAVTVDGALVGYTYNVQTTSSTVRTIIDSEASIAALLSSSRDQGTVRGTLDVDGNPLCRMYYLPEDNLPRPGDEVVTSGVGMSFPKGIPIGTVQESTRGMESNKSYVVIEPLADFQHIEYVIVLRYQPEAGAVEDRSQDSSSQSITPLDTPRPVPTIMIGTEFFQLAPTPIPTVTPEPEYITDEEGNLIEVTPVPTEESTEDIEYHLPSATDSRESYVQTATPEPSPTPTPHPIDLTVEEE